MMNKDIRTLTKLRDRREKSHQLYLANLYKAKKYFERYKEYAFKVERVQEELTA
jgi:hypothetical protein